MLSHENGVTALRVGSLCDFTIDKKNKLMLVMSQNLLNVQMYRFIIFCWKIKQHFIQV